MVKNNSHYFAAFCLIVIVFLLWFLNLDKNQFFPYKFSASSQERSNQAVDIKTTKELISLFNKSKFDQSLMEKNIIPNVFVKSIPADIKSINNIQDKKNIFIRLMLPIIKAEQKLLRQQRIIAKLILENRQQLTQPNVIHWFDRVKTEYKIPSKLNYSEQKDELLKRLDDLPLTLILAQAAIESAWGTSRFALEGNSLFGQWSFDNSEGIIPARRNAGKSHRIKAFPTLQASIRSYLKNINRNKAYKELREDRAVMRLQKENLNAHKLAKRLHRYSQKGKQYVKIIQRLLKSTDFKNLERFN